MKTFNPAQLAEFLSLLDQELRAPEHLIVIGGAAAALHYGAKRNTSDINTFNALPPAVEKGVRTVQQSSRLGITVSRAAIAAPPWNFEDRLEAVGNLRLKMLVIRVPERHDLLS